jgi:hypothetical protein
MEYWGGEMERHVLLVWVARAVTTVLKGLISFDFHITLSVTTGFVIISGANSHI